MLLRALVVVVVVAVSAAVAVVAPAVALAQSSRFGDVAEDAFYKDAVTQLDRVGVFTGTECEEGFCPGGVMDRKTMAVWVVRVLGRQDPPTVAESRFEDVDADGFFAPFIEKLADLGVTTGCGDGTRFCPDSSVTRAQMAVFLSRTYQLAEGPDPGFMDVSPGNWFADHVARLAASGITTGCGDGTRFCPGRDTTRAQMAVFLWRAETTPVVLAAGTCGVVEDEARLLVDGSDGADWSPDCSRIVYAYGGSLWVMDNDGRSRQRIVSDNDAWLRTPAWSPDGTRIAYGRTSESNGSLFSHIWTVDADGTDRTRVSRGDVYDSWPSWSPLGDRITFQRYSGDGRDEGGDVVNPEQNIFVANAAGGDEMVLTERTGRWESTPAWSPDGSRIAYLSGGAVWLIDPDGADAPWVVAGALWDGGLSWSPDGTRIAFVRPDGDGSSIVIADINGLNAETITGSDELDTAPRWSPDGQRILFTRSLAGDRQQLHVVGASGVGVPVPVDCRPVGPASHWNTAGFPLHPDLVRANGTVRIAVLFMDFPDAEAAHTTQAEAMLGLPWAEAYLETASYGKLDIEFVPLHRWLRATKDSAHYTNASLGGAQSLELDASVEAVALADEEFDFSAVNMVLTVFPSSHFSGGNATGQATADDVTLQTTRANTFGHDEEQPPEQWGFVGAHEIAHIFGLADLYSYSPKDPPEPPDGSVWAQTDWGLMHLHGWFQTRPDDARLSITLRSPYGDNSSATGDRIDMLEMLAWSRWQTGWLQEAQVLCMTQPEATVTLAPIAMPGAHLAMVAVPLNSHEVIVIESRRKLGYDNGFEYSLPDGYHYTAPGLPTEGVLVYTVDSLIETGSLPIKLAGDSDRQLDRFPVLQPGDSITLHGYTITVIADNGRTHTVTITQHS